MNQAVSVDAAAGIVVVADPAAMSICTKVDCLALATRIAARVLGFWTVNAL